MKKNPFTKVIKLLHHGDPLHKLEKDGSFIAQLARLEKHPPPALFSPISTHADPSFTTTFKHLPSTPQSAKPAASHMLQELDTIFGGLGFQDHADYSYDNIWKNIDHSLVTCYDELIEALRDTSVKYANEYADDLENLFQQLKFDDVDTVK